MKLSISRLGWVVLTGIVILAVLLGIIYGRTSYIPNICSDLKKQYGEPITIDHPAYSPYLDNNNNGIACD